MNIFTGKFSSNFDQKEATEDFLAGYKAGYTAAFDLLLEENDRLKECLKELVDQFCYVVAGDEYECLKKAKQLINHI